MDSHIASTLAQILPDEKDALARVQLFRDVELDSISQLINLCHFVTLDEDQLLLSPEQANDNVYVVLSGRLSVYIDVKDQRQPLTTIDKGECVGEISTIDDKMPSACVVATEASHLLAIPRDVLWKMISESHCISRNLLYLLSSNIRVSNRIISNSLEAQMLSEEYAMFDPVTGLHNRSWMDDAFQRELDRCMLDNEVLSLIMFDVDDFKKYNDSHGHIAGDRVLRMIGDRIHECLRPNDMIARFGGEEFAVLLPCTGLPQAVAVAERIRRHIRRLEPQSVSKVTLPGVTLSLGVAECVPGMDMSELLHKADQAMYHAKFSGKNCVSA